MGEGKAEENTYHPLCSHTSIRKAAAERLAIQPAHDIVPDTQGYPSLGHLEKFGSATFSSPLDPRKLTHKA